MTPGLQPIQAHAESLCHALAMLLQLGAIVRSAVLTADGATFVLARAGTLPDWLDAHQQSYLEVDGAYITVLHDCTVVWTPASRAAAFRPAREAQ